MPNRLGGKPRVYLCRARKTAKSSIAGQGFHSLGFSREQEIVNKAHKKRVSREDTTYIKVLSEAAKAHISKNARKFDDRVDEREPPFMAPSENPDDYSNWCSSCGEHAPTLVLCAGCRVSICTSTPEYFIGCLIWNPIISGSDFIYHCPYCLEKSKQRSQLQLRVPLRVEKHKVWHRFDPPVLIIAITWHLTQTRFGEFLHKRLALSYVNNVDSILRLDIPLGAPIDGPSDDDDVAYTEFDLAEAEKFLAKHPTAKIVTVIDAHCSDTGGFIWKGHSPATYEACSLPEILEVIPEEIHRYLSDAHDSPEHHHESIILNLACGASVSQLVSRDALLKDHCADAVFSMSNTTTVVGDVASPIADFAARWVQSPSDYDFLVASTLKTSWVAARGPVLSTHEHGHTLYTQFSLSEPGGDIVVCHRNCLRKLVCRPSKNNVCFTCNDCGSRCKTPIIMTDKTTVLGREALINTVYPQAQYPTEWRFLPQSDEANNPQPPYPLVVKPRPALEDKKSTKVKVRATSTANVKTSMASGHLAAPETMIRAASLPGSSTSTVTPSSTSLKIRLPPRPYVELMPRSHSFPRSSNDPPSTVRHKRLPDEVISSTTTHKRRKED